MFSDRPSPQFVLPLRCRLGNRCGFHRGCRFLLRLRVLLCRFLAGSCFAFFLSCFLATSFQYGASRCHPYERNSGLRLKTNRSLAICSTTRIRVFRARNQGNRSQQSGRFQRVVFVIVPTGRKGLASLLRAGLVFLKPFRKLTQKPVTGREANVIRILLVADKTVAPQIRDPNFEFVCAGFQRIGDLGQERRLPFNSQFLCRLRAPPQ